MDKKLGKKKLYFVHDYASSIFEWLLTEINDQMEKIRKLNPKFQKVD